MVVRRNQAAVPRGFDYVLIDWAVAERVRSSAARIRERVKHTVAAIIVVGDELRAVKAALPHGDFGLWVREEFGWTERTARNFMAVAERFGGYRPRAPRAGTRPPRPQAVPAEAASSPITPSQRS
jgi:hypothetical protein